MKTPTRESAGGQARHARSLHALNERRPSSNANRISGTSGVPGRMEASASIQQAAVTSQCNFGASVPGANGPRLIPLPAPGRTWGTREPASANSTPTPART